MKRQYCYPFPRPAVTVDLVVFANGVAGGPWILLVRRKGEPFAGRWALPGGFLGADERGEVAALRELKEETGLVVSGGVEPLGVFDNPGRDPRGWTLSLAFVGVVSSGDTLPEVLGGDDAKEARWWRVGEPGQLAFDHDLILSQGLAWLGRRGVGD